MSIITESKATRRQIVLLVMIMGETMIILKTQPTQAIQPAAVS
jgi:hypothetical protein